MGRTTDCSSCMAVTLVSKPVGRSTWMCDVFGPSQDGESENSGSHSVGTFALFGEAPFFGYFLWRCKESNSPSRAKWFSTAAAHRALEAGDLFVGSRIKGFRLAAGSFSLLAQRKGTKRKGLVTNQTCHRDFRGDFRTRPPWLDPKMAGILPAALRVWPVRRLLGKKTKVVAEMPIGDMQ